MYNNQVFCSANNGYVCGNLPDESHVSQYIVSGRRAFAINDGELEDSCDHSANN
jgi:hypothetical protein